MSFKSNTELNDLLSSPTITNLTRKRMVFDHLDYSAKTPNFSISRKSSPLDLTSSLHGSQLDILRFIIDFCKENGGDDTGKIRMADCAVILGISKELARKSFGRLCEKGIIKKLKTQRGNGGFSDFKVDEIDEIRTFLAKKTKSAQSPDMQCGELSAKLEIEPENINLPLEWQKINVHPLQDIGFGRQHLKQLLSLELSPEVIQESIYHYAFDLKHNPDLIKKIKTSKIAFFIGSLRKNHIYSMPDNYKSPQDLALEKVLKSLNHNKQSEEHLKEIIFFAKFNEWYKNLSNQDIERAISDQQKYFTREHIAALPEREKERLCFCYFKSTREN